jgi:hypothetical protein
VTLAWPQNEAREVAQRIDQRHDPGRQPAARSADGLISSPPLRRRRAGGPGRWCRRRSRIRSPGHRTSS